MKLRLVDKLLITLLGVVTIVGALSLVLEAFFAVPVTAWLGTMLTLGTTKRIVACVALIIIALALGAFAMLRPWKKNKSSKWGFVMQQAENGEIGISMRALESLVHKCLDQHEEIQLNSIGLSETRSGLVVKLRVGMASGMNIPLAVSALQKQIRQYVTACSGVDVTEVRVQVDNAENAPAEGVYAVENTLGALPVEEPMPTPPVTLEPVAVPAALEAAQEQEPEEEVRPMHQRLFGAEEQPAIVPAPPVEEAPVQEEPVEEMPEDTAEETVNDEVCEAEISADEAQEPVQENTFDELFTAETDATVDEPAEEKAGIQDDQE